jgi:nucleotide-binding universal stress UspA family protein
VAAGFKRGPAIVRSMPGGQLHGLKARDLKEISGHLDALTLSEGQPAKLLLEAPRIKRVLLAIDGSPASRHATAWAKAVASAFGAFVDVVSVAPNLKTAVRDPSHRHDWSAVQEAFEECEAEAAEVLGLAKHALDGFKTKTHFERGSPVARIVSLARELEPDLVILGSHGHSGFERLALGSVAEGVKHRVKCSILIARNDPPPHHIVTGTDGSKHATRAVRFALELGARMRAPVTVAHALDAGSYGSKGWSARLEDLDIQPPKQLLDGRLRFHAGKGKAAILLVDVAEEAGLLVVGGRGLGGFASAMLGSVSDKVTRTAKTSVLVVKGA